MVDTPKYPGALDSDVSGYLAQGYTVTQAREQAFADRVESSGSVGMSTEQGVVVMSPATVVQGQPAPYIQPSPQPTGYVVPPEQDQPDPLEGGMSPDRPMTSQEQVVQRVADTRQRLGEVYAPAQRVWERRRQQLANIFYAPPKQVEQRGAGRYIQREVAQYGQQTAVGQQFKQTQPFPSATYETQEGVRGAVMGIAEAPYQLLQLPAVVAGTHKEPQFVGKPSSQFQSGRVLGQVAGGLAVDAGLNVILTASPSQQQVEQLVGVAVAQDARITPAGGSRLSTRVVPKYVTYTDDVMEIVQADKLDARYFAGHIQQSPQGAVAKMSVGQARIDVLKQTIDANPLKRGAAILDSSVNQPSAQRWILLDFQGKSPDLDIMKSIDPDMYTSIKTVGRGGGKSNVLMELGESYRTTQTPKISTPKKIYSGKVSLLGEEVELSKITQIKTDPDWMASPYWGGGGRGRAEQLFIKSGSPADISLPKSGAYDLSLPPTRKKGAGRRVLVSSKNSLIRAGRSLIGGKSSTKTKLSSALKTKSDLKLGVGSLQRNITISVPKSAQKMGLSLGSLQKSRQKSALKQKQSLGLRSARRSSLSIRQPTIPRIGIPSAGRSRRRRRKPLLTIKVPKFRGFGRVKTPKRAPRSDPLSTEITAVKKFTQGKRPIATSLRGKKAWKEFRGSAGFRVPTLEMTRSRKKGRKKRGRLRI